MPLGLKDDETTGHKNVEAVKAVRTGFHQDIKNYLLHLTSGSLKFQRRGIKLWRNLEEQIAYAMANYIYCYGELIEETSEPIGIFNLGIVFTMPKYFE